MYCRENRPAAEHEMFVLLVFDGGTTSVCDLCVPYHKMKLFISPTACEVFTRRSCIWDGMLCNASRLFLGGGTGSAAKEVASATSIRGEQQTSAVDHLHPLSLKTVFISLTYFIFTR